MTDLKWWQTAVFYQIYPRSFADGNGDGIGDLQGMTAKLDYLKDLGIGAVWLSPHYPSPMVDCGYDIASYVDVAPEYGTLDDFRVFLEQAHARGIRVVLDLVLNHTSDQHPWFLESRSSRDNPRRDWYIWHDGKNGGPPNNWYSTFGGSAWQWDETTRSYYYHFFFKEQPDLNWRNPAVKQAMWDVVRFWLDMGVDGFRLDAIGTVFEEPGLPDQTSGITLDDLYRLNRLAATPEEKAYAKKKETELFRHQHDLPGMHDLMRELRAVVDEYDDRVLIGETHDVSYYGSGSDELHLIFNFPLMRTNRITPRWARANQQVRLSELPPGAWPCNTLGNHDAPRMYSNFGDGLHDDQLARLNLALLLTLKGTPVVYNGEEIGMTDYLITDVNRYRDPLGIRAYRLEMDLMGSGHQQAVLFAALNGRDRCRTPFQWSNQPDGGFCPKGVEPWLPVNPNFAQGVNLVDQAGDPASLYNYYRALLHLRRSTPALISGDYTPLLEDNPDVLVFQRAVPGQTCLVVLNYSAYPQQLALKPGTNGQILFSSTARPAQNERMDRVTVQPFECIIAELQAS